METLFYEQIRKKFGKYAIHNLTMVLIMCYVAGYVIELMGKAAGNNLLGISDTGPLPDPARTSLETGDLGDRSSGKSGYLHDHYAVFLL